MSEIDIQRAQILRQQCNRHFAGKRIHDVVGAIQMLTVDALISLPGMTEDGCLAAYEAVAADVRAIIHERFTTGTKQ